MTAMRRGEAGRREGAFARRLIVAGLMLVAALPASAQEQAVPPTADIATVAAAATTPAAQAAPAPAPENLDTPAEPPTTEAICALIGTHADAAGMDRDFFARLIWKESRFDVGAISPVGAQGIAQFMPYTARERGLADPYDLEEAIRHSALYLADLKRDLGNWGLAAAAYNGGINRVKRWMASGGSLPAETEDYVYSITSRSADWFKEDGREVEARPLDATLSFDAACPRLPVMRTRAIFAAYSPATPESAPMKPWGVQVAGHADEAVAMKMFQRLQGTHPALLGGQKPIVVRARPISGPRRITAVRIGADSRAEADAFCGRLKGAGASCVVMKN